MDDAHLEAVTVEAEVTLDPAQETLDPGVRPDGAPTATRSVCAYQAGVESFPIGTPHGLLEGAPVRALDLLE